MGWVQEKAIAKPGGPVEPVEPVNRDSAFQNRRPGQGSGAMRLGGAVTNIPSSAKRMGGEIVDAAMHPERTAKAIGNLGAGVVEKFIPGEQKHEIYADSALAFFKQEYGSPELIRKAFEEDPVGLLSNFGGFMAAGGLLVRGAGMAVQGAGIVSGIKGLESVGGMAAAAGKGVSAVGQAMEPLSVAGRAARHLPQAMPNTLGVGAYRSSMKWGTTIPEVLQNSMAITGLQNKVMPTLRGLNKLRTKIDDINVNIEKIIDKATADGKRIPTTRLMKNLRELRNKEILVDDPLEVERLISDARKQIYEGHIYAGRSTMTPAQMQKIKQNIYQKLESYYQKQAAKPISSKISASVARAAKESIEDLYPEIKEFRGKMKKMNADEGALIELHNAIDRSAGRISNRDFIGIGVPIKGISGGTMGGVPGGIAGLVLGIMDAPLPKAKLAILVHQMANHGIQVSPNLRRIALSIEAGRSRAGEEGIMVSPDQNQATQDMLQVVHGTIIKNPKTGEKLAWDDGAKKWDKIK